MLTDILRTIYFAVFDTHINYANLIWGQNLNSESRVVILKKESRKTDPTIFLNLKAKYFL